MKQCPACRRTFADDTLVYCLEDGTALGNACDPGATQIMPPPRVTNPPPTEFAPSNFPPPQAPPRRSYLWLIVILASGLLLCIVAAGAVIIWVNERDKNAQETSPASQSSTNKNQRNETNSNANQKDSTSSVTETSPSAKLVGVWRTSVSELGTNEEITYTFFADGTSRAVFENTKGRTARDHGTWQYSDGILYEKFSNGASGNGSIEWIDNDTFVITIIDNGVPAYNGLKRRYRRVG
ncbi:MAG TPA: lipocalin family protein [Pyrinomonadaceae bacterium]|nr:lipocalin family protein [Pyrinomonadaceae bacterium]